MMEKAATDEVVERENVCFRCRVRGAVPGLAVCEDCIERGPLRPVEDSPRA